ncbi:hypothetical protein GCM10026988_28530 [Vibrio panuliri]
MLQYETKCSNNRQVKSITENSDLYSTNSCNKLDTEKCIAGITIKIVRHRNGRVIAVLIDGVEGRLKVPDVP